MFDIRTLLIAIPALPLLAAIATALLGPKLLRQQSHWLAIFAIAGSFVGSVMLLSQVQSEIVRTGADGYAHIETLWTWAAVSDASQVQGQSVPFEVDVTLRADSLTAIMLCMVTLIATLVSIYAAGYMHGDRSYWRFFAYVAIFVFSMTMLVMVSNFLLLFVFWEAVGACSYLLIGFWYDKPTAAAAGKKAFLVNRVGDFGFALAIFLIWTTYGTLNYHDTATTAGVLGQARLSGAVEFATGGTALAICLLLFVGCCGKSAQLPLHVWLPDAMEGPTPVSALIHAATMVTAGVYLVIRCTPLFMLSPDAQLVVASIGGVTALMAGIIALTQHDLKRVLAYSTISQLGYMFLALGTGSLAGIVAAMFHLFTHAFFKALLFLGAGSVMHSMGNVIDMRRFGGLKRIMPITCVTFAIGSLALAGVPPLSGFFSKDAILGAVHDRIHEADHVLEMAANPARPIPTVNPGEQTLLVAAGETTGHAGAESHGVGSDHGGHAMSHSSVYQSLPITQVRLHRQVYQWLYWSGLVTAFLTAFYTFRAFFLTFFGEEVIPSEAGHHAHESPKVMWMPLAILSFFALFVGFVIFASAEKHQPDAFAKFLTHTPSLSYAGTWGMPLGEFHADVAAISMVIALLGVGSAAFLYLGNQREISWISSLMQFGWIRQAASMQWLKSLGKTPVLAGIHRLASSIGLAWLTQTIGYLSVALVGIVLSPLLLGYYLSPYKLSAGKFFVDEIYQLLIVRPLEFFAQALYLLDRWVIDGLVNLLGKLPVEMGNRFRKLQAGFVPQYSLSMIAAAFVLLVAYFAWGSSVR